VIRYEVQYLPTTMFQDNEEAGHAVYRGVLFHARFLYNKPNLISFAVNIALYLAECGG